MKLEVGMYCFDKTNRKQGIGKILTKPTKYNNVAIEYKDDIPFVSVGNVIASHNIIDLIEEGDYVNGERVIALEKDVDKRNIYPSNVGAKIFTDYELQGNWYFGIQEEDIKSIVTSQQFENMKYKIGD